LPQIGREFGNKHHTTVLHSINKIELQRQEDTDLKSYSDFERVFQVVFHFACGKNVKMRWTYSVNRVSTLLLVGYSQAGISVKGLLYKALGRVATDLNVSTNTVP